MDLSFRRNPSCLVVRVKGDLDLSSVTTFKTQVDREFRSSGLSNMVLHLRDMDFVDSTGLGAILGRMRYVTSGGGRMVMASASPRVVAMLEMAGFGSLLPMARSEAEACRMLSCDTSGTCEGGPNS